MQKIQEFLNKNTIQSKILLVIIITIIVLASYEVWTRYNSGKITISVPYQNSSVFLDGKKIKTTTTNKQTIKLGKISTGRHSILVYTENRYPWKKTVEIKKGDVVKIYPFLMLSKLTKGDPGIIKLTKEGLLETELLFKKQKKNTEISNSGTGNIEIKKENNAIFAAWIGGESLIPNFFCKDDKCGKIIKFFSSKTGPIKNIGFYPKREDVVIFSLGNSIYAIDINKKNTQNFQPIYTGNKPDFVINNQNSILYIKDEGLIFGVKL